jgi:hypothetical protein
VSALALAGGCAPEPGDDAAEDTAPYGSPKKD